MFYVDAVAHRAHGDRRKIDYLELPDLPLNDVAIQSIVSLGARFPLKQAMLMRNKFFDHPADGAIDKGDIVATKRTAFGISQKPRIGGYKFG